MDWIHCNTCFILPSDSKQQFRLTSCGHLFCETCLKKDTEKKCKTCGQMYSGAIPLSNQMKPDVQIYFTDVKDVCKTATKHIQQAQQVAEFQKGHIQRLAMFRKHQLAKATEVIVQAKELDRKYRLVVKENEQLKSFIASLGYQAKNVLEKDSLHAKSPGIPKTPQNPVTPSLLRSLSNNSLMSLNSQLAASPRPSQLLYRSPGVHLHPSPMKVNASPSRSNRPSPSSRQVSPSNGPNGYRNAYKNSMIQRSSNAMVTPGRITIRTPPVNGRLGPINSSPIGSSPRTTHTPSSSQRIASQIRSPSPQASQHSSRSGIHQNHPYMKAPTSKIAQILHAGRSMATVSNQVANQSYGTPRDERRPIQLQSSKPSSINRSGGPR